jgi:uncharacterized membrane protein YbjE (DUF340 family)
MNVLPPHRMVFKVLVLLQFGVSKTKLSKMQNTSSLLCTCSSTKLCHVFYLTQVMGSVIIMIYNPPTYLLIAHRRYTRTKKQHQKKYKTSHYYFISTELQICMVMCVVAVAGFPQNQWFRIIGSLQQHCRSRQNYNNRIGLKIQYVS